MLRHRRWGAVVRLVAATVLLLLAGFGTATVAFSRNAPPPRHHHEHGDRDDDDDRPRTTRTTTNATTATTTTANTTTRQTTSQQTTTQQTTSQQTTAQQGTSQQTTAQETTAQQTTTQQTTSQQTTTQQTTTRETSEGTTTQEAAPQLADVDPPVADVSVVADAPLVARVDQLLSFSMTVANDGPDAATGVVLYVPIPAGAALVSIAASPARVCAAVARAACFIGTLQPGQSVEVTAVVTAAQQGPLTLAPSVESDYDASGANNGDSATAVVISSTAPPPPPPPPTEPGTYNAIGGGTIVVNGVAQAADELFVLLPGDVVDVTAGAITFTAVDGGHASFASSQFVTARRTSGRTAGDDVPASFTVAKPRAVGDPTTVTLAGGDFSTCNAPRALAAGDRPVRQLWGSAKGKFRTVGRFSAATIRGTVWLTQDRCNGTYTESVESVVDVFDTTTKKTIALYPGQSYLAKPPAAAKKPPRQKPKKVTKQKLPKR